MNRWQGGTATEHLSIIKSVKSKKKKRKNKIHDLHREVQVAEGHTPPLPEFLYIHIYIPIYIDIREGRGGARERSLKVTPPLPKILYIYIYLMHGERE